jgi:hypothetical protein
MSHSTSQWTKPWRGSATRVCWQRWPDFDPSAPASLCIRSSLKPSKTSRKPCTSFTKVSMTKPVTWSFNSRPRRNAWRMPESACGSNTRSSTLQGEMNSKGSFTGQASRACWNTPTDITSHPCATLNRSPLQEQAEDSRQRQPSNDDPTEPHRLTTRQCRGLITSADCVRRAVTGSASVMNHIMDATDLTANYNGTILGSPTRLATSCNAKWDNVDKTNARGSMMTSTPTNGGWARPSMLTCLLSTSCMFPTDSFDGTKHQKGGWCHASTAPARCNL